MDQRAGRACLAANENIRTAAMALIRGFAIGARLPQGSRGDIVRVPGTLSLQNDGSRTGGGAARRSMQGRSPAALPRVVSENRLLTE